MSEYVASLDVGTTTIRCQIVDSSAEIVGLSRCSVKLVYPQPGFVEIDPDELWKQIVFIIKSAISNSGLKVGDIKTIGISTQRSTFTTWKKDTGETLHNFITWKDMRAKDICKSLNKSLSIQTLRYGAYSIYLLTQSKRFLTGSNLKITPNHTTGRLLWVLQNIPAVKDALNQDNLQFGTIDTWLLYKFTKKHLTDISNASANGFYDPFVFDWGFWAKYFIGIPFKILPKVVSNDWNFGCIEEGIFGAEIPIGCVMSDQSSSMYASNCLNENDLKVTLGTGAFFNVNTSGTVHPSASGIYPLIAWKFGQKLVCVAEAPCNDCGSLVEWLLGVGLLQNAKDSGPIAEKAAHNDGVYFVPAFSGLGPPINDMKAASGFLGIKPTTGREHLVRAVLEAIAYRIAFAYQQLYKERPKNYDKMIVDGGVANNDFICQLISNLTGLKLERLQTTEMSVWGVALIAGKSIGLWSRDDLKKNQKVEQTFSPDNRDRSDNLKEFKEWLQVVDRFTDWYED